MHVISGARSNESDLVELVIAVYIFTVDDPTSIARVFAEKHRELYSSAPYDLNEMQRINDYINCLLSFERRFSDYIFSFHDISRDEEFRGRHM
jgi:hypothetical protein